MAKKQQPIVGKLQQGWVENNLPIGIADGKRSDIAFTVLIESRTGPIAAKPFGSSPCMLFARFDRR